MRLDKYLSQAGVGTRSEVKKLIRAGKVAVGDTLQKDPQVHLREEDRVYIGGKEIRHKSLRYFLLYKPAGCVSAVKDNVHPTVMEFLKEENIKDCAPVGRLDLDTEGILLITNDGELSHRLLSPTKHVEKTYFAILDRECPEDAIEEFEKGIDIGDEKPTLPAGLVIENPPTEARLTICEGRFHQVKRMFERVGCKVTYLRREKMAFLDLKGLSPGEYRELRDDEVKNLYKGEST